MRSLKINSGWALALTGWIISSNVFPFLPEIMKTLLDGVRLGVFGFPLMEYAATIALWSVIFLFVWIPAGFKASKIYKENGLKSSRNYVVIVFSVQLVFLCIVFRFFWNS